MTSNLTKSLLAGLALASLTTAPALADETAPATRTEVHKACKVMVLNGDSATPGSMPEHSVMVTARSVDGADPAMIVNVLGRDGQPGETFEVQSLAVGETKTFTTADGRSVEMTRTEEAVNLTVDGKEIVLPSLANVAMIHGGGEVVSQLLTEDVVGTGSGDRKVMVFTGAPHVAMGGAMALPMGGNFENLKALEGADPAVKQMVLEALHEIFSQQAGSGFNWTMATDAPEGAVATEGQALPGQHVIVRRVNVAPAAGEGSRVE